MLLDIDAKEFEEMARAGFFENVRLRAQSLGTVQDVRTCSRFRNGVPIG